ncbi:MAG: hypothetical protein ABSE06_01280 [Anaerolineaceae bacterium]|jgi:uncharacterized CHY-type Zn-finger protein
MDDFFLCHACHDEIEAWEYTIKLAREDGLVLCAKCRKEHEDLSVLAQHGAGGSDLSCPNNKLLREEYQ